MRLAFAIPNLPEVPRPCVLLLLLPNLHVVVKKDVRQFRECLDWCGEDAGTISLQEHSQIDGTVSMRSFLGRGAFLFCLATSSGRARSTPIKIDVVDDMVDGHVTVNFMKPAVTFNFYFQDELSRSTWHLFEVKADVLNSKDVGVGSPVELHTKFKRQPAWLRADTLWKTWLQPMLCKLGEENETGVYQGVYQKLARVIEQDIMSSHQCRRRNVLQEMDRPSSVNVYFTLDDFEGLKLRLKLRFPELAIFVPQGQDVDVMRDRIWEMPVVYGER